MQSDAIFWSTYAGRAQPPRKTWMSTTTPSEKYTGGRKLEAAEAHISRIGPLVVTCYPGHVLRHG